MGPDYNCGRVSILPPWRRALRAAGGSPDGGPFCQRMPPTRTWLVMPALEMDGGRPKVDPGDRAASAVRRLLPTHGGNYSRLRGRPLGMRRHGFGRHHG